MILIAIASLIFGVLCGLFVFNAPTAALFSDISQYALYVLMCAVGIGVGSNKKVFVKIKQYGFKILMIPGGIIAATLLSGFACAALTKMPLNASMAIVSGLGWYSLSSILVADLAGAQAGSIAFLSNLLREILAFMLIPVIARYLNFYTAIAPAAATSEDTTLPMLIKYTNEEVVIMAVVNGILCSAAVPVLIPFMYSIF